MNPETRTLTLLVTITGTSTADLVRAENRIFDGLKWLHPAVEYQVVPIEQATPHVGIDAPADAEAEAVEPAAHPPVPEPVDVPQAPAAPPQRASRRRQG